MQILPTPLANNWQRILISVLCLTYFFTLLPLALNEGYAYGGDHTSHWVYTVRIAQMIKAGDFSFWLPDFNMGHPLFFYYQPIAHLITAGFYLLFPFADPLTIYKLIVVMLLSLLPLSIYKGLRLMDFTKLQALCCAALVMAIKSWEVGYELRSCFDWGLYTHLWGMVILLPVVGTIYKRYLAQQSWYLSAVLLGLTFLTHSLTGISACIAVALLYLLPTTYSLRQKGRELGYLIQILVGMLLIAAIIMIPTILYSDYVSGFFELSPEHRFGLGLNKAFSYFIEGKIYDHKRFPYFTLLVINGFALAVYRVTTMLSHKQQVYNMTFILLNFIVGFLLICGTETFTFLKYSSLYDAVPMLRLIIHFHLYSVVLAGIFLAQVVQYALQLYHKPNKLPKTMGVILLGGVIFILAYFLQYQVRELSRYSRTFAPKNDPAYFEAIAFLKTLPEGRVHTPDIKSHFRLHVPPILANKPIGVLYATSCEANLGIKYLSQLNAKQVEECQLLGIKYVLSPIKKDFSSVGDPIFQNDRYQITQVSGNTGYFDIVQSNTLSLSNNRAARDLIIQWMHDERLLQQKQYIAIADQHPADYFAKEEFYRVITPTQQIKRDAAPKYELFNHRTQERLQVIIDHQDKSFGNYMLQDTTSNVLSGVVLSEQNNNGYYQARVQINTDSTNRSNKTNHWVLLRVNAHPDWVATIDGNIVDWVQMSPCFMAVKVPNGTHVIEFKFQFSRFRLILLAISLATLMALFILNHKTNKK